MTKPGIVRTGKEFDLDRLLFQFDQAWQSLPPPRIEDYLALLGQTGDRGPPTRRELLEELVKIDLEYRWRQPDSAARQSGWKPRPCLEDYLGRYPDLAPLNRMPLELIGVEYRVRRRWGDRPNHDSYANRFPKHGSELQQLLQSINADLATKAPAR